jgi:hypothetical protein
VIKTVVENKLDCGSAEPMLLQLTFDGMVAAAVAVHDMMFICASL